MGKSDFFLMIAIIAALAGVAVLAVARPVNRMLESLTTSFNQVSVAVRFGTRSRSRNRED